MNLQDIFNNMSDDFIPDKQDVQKLIFKKAPAPRKKSLLTICISALSALCIVGLLVFSYIFFYLRPDTTVNILGDAARISKIVAVTPTKETQHGVCTDTAVKIVTRSAMSKTDLQKHLIITPTCDYKIIKTGSNRFSLRFTEDLQSNTVYTVASVVDNNTIYRWALQTETTFGITQVIDTQNSIEFTFSSNNVMGFEEAFSITPEVNGSFLHRGRVWVFIPDQPFESQVLYNVTIDKQIGGPEGQGLQENYNYRFVGSQSDGTYTHILHDGFDISDTFLTTEAPIAQIETNVKVGNSAEIELFKFSDFTAYQTFHANYAQQYSIVADAAQYLAAPAQNGLQTYHRFTTTFARGASQTTYILYYPKALPAGYYIARIEFGDVTLYQLLQSTDYAVYTMSTNGDYTVWLNSASTGSAIANALVQSDDISVTTNEEGIASFQINEAQQTDGRYLIIGADKPFPYVSYIESTSVSADTQRQKQFFTHLYLNSSVYNRNDTISFWGLALPKGGQTSYNGSFTLYSSWNQKETKLTITEDHTFSGELKLQNLLSRNYGYIELRLDGTTLCSAYFSVNDYTLPMYQSVAKPEKTAYFYDETINVSVTAQYNNGMVAAEIPVTHENDKTTLSTDAEGGALFTFTPSIDTASENYCSWEPMYIGYDFTVGESIESSRVASSPTLQFYNKIMIQGEVIEGNETHSLKISTHQIDLTLLNQSSIASYEYVSPAKYIGGAVSVPATVEIHEVTYDRVQSGTPTYDPINKKMMYNYDFVRKDTVVETKTVQTRNGIALINDLTYSSNEEKTYYYKLCVTEADGRISSTMIYPTKENMAFCDYVYNLRVQNNQFKENQSVDFSLYSNNSLVDMHTGSLLVTEVQNGILRSAVVRENSFSLTASQEWLPDMCVYGAYFDGKHIYRVGYVYLQYDASEKELSVSLTPDKDSYQPGETVNLEIEVTDKVGAPVQSSYNINVMDIALLQYADHQDNLIANLYQSNCWYSEVYTAVSYRNFSNELGFGEGGGGAGEWRGNFEDNPVFLCGKTDDSGHATVSFELPDTVTTWVIQAQAANQTAYAGSARKEIVSTLPFITQAIVPQTVKTTDDLSVAVKSVGKTLSVDQTITHTVSILSEEKILQKQQISSIGSAYCYATFSTLPEGNYTVEITSVCGNQKDAVSYPVSVQSTSVGGYFVSTKDIQQATKFETNILEESAQLLLYDKKRQLYVDILQKLQSSAGERLDQKIATTFATAFMQDITASTLSEQNWSFMEQYGAASVGYSLFPDNTQSDLLLNVKLAMAARDICDTEALSYYFDQVISEQTSPNDDILLAYIGKAALGEPILQDLKYLYGTGENLTQTQRLYIALAFAYGGDYSAAYSIYEQHIRPQFSAVENTIFLDMPSSEETERLTGFALMLASRIHAAEAESIANYILQNEQTEVSLLLDTMSFLYWCPADNTENQVTLTHADGKEETITYQKNSMYRCTIDTASLTSLKISEKSGDTVAAIGGYTALQDVQSTATAILGEINTTMPNQASLGERFFVEIAIRPQKEIFSQTELYVKLPAGLQLTGNHLIDETKGTVTYSNALEEIHIHLYQTEETSISVECEAALPGRYIMEPILLLCKDQYLNSTAIELEISNPTTIQQ